MKDAAKSPMVSLEEVHRSTAQVVVSVGRKTISFHKFGFTRGIAQKGFVEIKSGFQFATGHAGNTPNVEEGSDEMSPNLSFLVYLQNATKQKTDNEHISI